MNSPQFLMGLICGIMVLTPALLILWLGEKNDKDR